MSDHDDRDSLYGRNLWRDRKDRLAAGREGGFHAREDELSAFADSHELLDDDRAIVELMRRDVNLRTGGSKGRRRRRQPAKSKQDMNRAATAGRTGVLSRIGRPAIGLEVRVYVQTSIAQRTRELLAAHGVTLAQIFDDYARRLAAHGA
jgi:hypothetical protein